MYKKIIVFEGVDGTGKSYHINQVAKFLKSKKIKFIKFREPGGSSNSEIIRKIILKNNSSLSKESDLLLYLAARKENYDKLIKPNLKKKIILIDRFVDSTLAYQHYGFNINEKKIKYLYNFVIGNLKADYTFLNILPHKLLAKRIGGKKNKYDNYSKKFYEKVQNGFIKILGKNKHKMIIKSNETKKFNEEKIINQIKKLLKIK